MRRSLQALILAGAFVGLVRLVAHYQLATPVPFFLLVPGIFAGALVPDSGFDPEGDIHPWGPISTTLVYTVNILVYSGIIYLILSLVHRARKTRTNPTRQPEPHV